VTNNQQKAAVNTIDRSGCNAATPVSTNVIVMSRRYWWSSEDKRRYDILEEAFEAIYGCYAVTSITSATNDDNPYYAPMIQIATEIEALSIRMFTPLENLTIAFGRMHRISDFNDSDCQFNFRFLKCDLQEIANQLWPRLSPYLNSVDPTRIDVGDRYVAHYETCFCLYLYKLSYPRQLVDDCECFFGLRKSHLSRMIIVFGSALCHLARRYFNNPNLLAPYMPYYAKIISDKCYGLVPNIWGFIDGTIRPTCRPIKHQNLLYTRYKHCHGIKFQSIVTPDGLIACLHGPFLAPTHDAKIFHESLVREKLEEIMPYDRDHSQTIYALYGDGAYPLSNYVFRGFHNAQKDSLEAQFNRRMSKVRIVVEWSFANILRRWQHLDFRRNQKILQQPVGQMFTNGAFLSNIATCFYGGATNKYFDCDVMELEEYLELIDEE
jgi:DDE superfamily endonuclease